MRMKALTLWRPYEELIKRGLKTCETRSWPAPEWLIGKRIAIHGGRTFDLEAWECGLAEDLRRYGSVDPDEIARASDWNIGRVVCTAVLRECYRMTYENIQKIPQLEYWVGGWEPGRYAWRLEGVRPLKADIRTGGQRGLFWWDAPEGIA